MKHRENLVLHCAPSPSIITLFNLIKHDVFTFLEARRKKQEKRGGASLWLHLVKHRENLVLHCAPNPTIITLFNPIKRDVFTFLEARRKKQEERGEQFIEIPY